MRCVSGESDRREIWFLAWDPATAQAHLGQKNGGPARLVGRWSHPTLPAVQRIGQPWHLCSSELTLLAVHRMNISKYHEVIDQPAILKSSSFLINSMTLFERPDPAHDLLCVECSRLSLYFLTCVKTDKSRDRGDVVSCSGALSDLRIDLCQNRFRCKTSCSLLERRGHHAAWTTPGSPEIDEHRHFSPCDKWLKRLVVQFHRMIRKQLGFASSAYRRVMQSWIRNPINGKAFGTCNFH